MALSLMFTNSQGEKLPIELGGGTDDKGQPFVRMSLPAGSAFTPAGVTPTCSMIIVSGRGTYRIGGETKQYAPGDDIDLEKKDYFGFTKVEENTTVLVYGI